MQCDVINHALIDGVTIAAKIAEKDSGTGKTWTSSGEKGSVKLYVMLHQTHMQA